jgi:uncharacterized membrane protein YjjP (DUF1212 family)
LTPFHNMNTEDVPVSIEISVEPPSEPHYEDHKANPYEISPGLLRADSTHSDLYAIGTPSILPRSATMDALVDQVSRSDSLQFKILNDVQIAPPTASIEIGNKGLILPSQEYVLKDHLLRKKFRKGKLEWKELKQISREWLAKADINTEPDELYVDGAATIDDEQVTYNDGTHEQKAMSRSQSMDVISESDANKGMIFDLISSIRECITGQPRKTKLPRTAPIPYRKMSSEQQRDVRLLIIDFGYAMSIYGIPSDRLEHNLIAVSNYYGVTGNYFVTPTGIWLNFGSIMEDDITAELINQPNYAFFVRVNAGSINLSKFAELDRLALHISSGRVVNISNARKKIREIVSAETLYQSPIFTLFIYAIFSGLFPVLMNGTWGEILAAFFGGLCVALITLGKEKVQLFDRIGNPLSSLISACVAIVFRFIFHSTSVHINVLMVSLAGVLMLLPGLGLTIAIAELSQGHLMSGTMRVVAVLVRVIELGFGMLIADQIDQFFDHTLHQNYTITDDYVRKVLPVWLKALCLPVLILIIIIMFRVPKYISAYIFITMGCFVAFFGDMYLRSYAGVEIGSILTAFFVGFIANIYSWVSKRPSNVVTICAIVLLVPGYISAASISSLLVNDVNTSVNLIFRAIMACVSLVTGLVVSEVLWTKKRGRLAY